MQIIQVLVRVGDMKPLAYQGHLAFKAARVQIKTHLLFIHESNIAG